MPTRPRPFRPTTSPTRASSDRRGYDHHWRKLRGTHLKQAPFCYACGEFATLVDHKIPVVIAPERRLDSTNLRSCCTKCHAIITTRFKREGINELPPEHLKTTPPSPASSSRSTGSGHTVDEGHRGSFFYEPFGTYTDPQSFTHGREIDRGRGQHHG